LAAFFFARLRLAWQWTRIGRFDPDAAYLRWSFDWTVGYSPMPLTLFIQSWMRLRVLASFAFENGWF
jgi:hypothetical protein